MERRWKVPSVNDDLGCWIGWDARFKGYTITRHTPEDEWIIYPERLKLNEWDDDGDLPLPTLPALVEATMVTVDWDRVSPDYLDEIRKAPERAYLDAPGSERVAGVLRMALTS